MARLIGHFREALQESMRRWSRALEENVGGARTPHDLQTGLVRMRGGLSRQLQLTRHPGLPPEIRRIFTGEMESAIAGLQTQLEETISRGTSATTTDRAHLDQLLRIVREAPLTAAIGMSTNDIDHARPAPQPLARPVDEMARMRRARRYMPMTWRA